MANSNQGSVASQVESLQRKFAQSPGLPFAELLPKERLSQVIGELDIKFHDRDYPPLVALAMLLSQSCDPDPSLKQAVARLIAQRLAEKQPACSSNTGAYSRARTRLPEKVLAELTRHTGAELQKQAPAEWPWHGRSVKVVDGSTASMPDTEANQAEYPQSSSQKPGVGFPIVRYVVIFALAVGTVLDAAFCPYQGKQNSELALFRQMHGGLKPGDVVLADRYFCSFFDIAECQRRGADVVMRQNQGRKTDFRGGVRLGRYDHLVVWPKPQRPQWMDEATYQLYPEELVMRELRVHVPGHRKVRSRTITIATTLGDHLTYRKKDIAELYRLRWQAELNLRSLKTVMQMDVLRGKTPEMVRKELWAHFLAYNLIRKVMCQAAVQFGLKPWTISFKGTLQTLNAFALPMMTCSRDRLAELIEEMLISIARHQVGKRPNRLEPRRVKRRAKPYELLQTPRAEARTLEIANSCG
jgi:Transposase DDE domain